MDGCFFCHPDSGRVLYESDAFYVLLGLGPIVDGYAILVAKDHVRSMLDLPARLRQEYVREKSRLQSLIRSVYGPSIITEHGRIQACAADDEEKHDLLCYHAHQLFFPLDVDLSTEMKRWPFDHIYTGRNMFELDSTQLHSDHEYLLFEDAEGAVHCYRVNGKCPRQFMRFLVAQAIGDPKLADWSKAPKWEGIRRAQVRYRMSGLIDAPSARSCSRHHWLMS